MEGCSGSSETIPETVSIYQIGVFCVTVDAPRALRADALRNRAKILDAARIAFRDKGYDAPLDDIAKMAGVGPGTLYRHFPNRESLMDAVMQTWVDRVEVATDAALAAEGSAHDVLLNWLTSYVGLVSTYKGNPAKITAAIDDPESPIAHKCTVLKAANERVIERLSGDLRPDVDSTQLARLIGGVAAVADQSDLTDEQTLPLLEVLANGLLA